MHLRLFWGPVRGTLGLSGTQKLREGSLRSHFGLLRRVGLDLSKALKDPQGRFWGLLARHEKQQKVMEGSLRSHDWVSFAPPGPPATNNGDAF